ncbi:hypothetical protein [Mesorhizobium sp.]|uniref:hypothetical protein n=1 Tax=Mesorhizobium sp. TaxID=1871066 RepID=UPI0025B7D0E4|nr:hypothetical protein [Mesorhizobium sp.]
MTTAHTIATVECGAIFVSLELSRSTWLVTTLAAPVGSKLSRHQVRVGICRGCWSGFRICNAMSTAGLAGLALTLFISMQAV